MERCSLRRIRSDRKLNVRLRAGNRMAGDDVEATRKGQNQSMKQSALVDFHAIETSERTSSRRLTFLRFLMRYPLFLLAFGPPIFRSGAAIDATKGVIDFWSFIQIGLIGSISVRAMIRLLYTREILIPKRVRSILRLIFILGALFLASAGYSPSRSVSAA